MRRRGPGRSPRQSTVALAIALALDVLAGPALSAEPREPALMDPPVTQPSPKQLVITEMPGARSVSRLRDVKNALIVIDTRSNYLKGISLQRLKGLAGMPLRVALDDDLLDKHVRQVRFLDAADVELRVSQRFLDDPGLISRVHRFGPVRVFLDAPAAIAAKPAFWARVRELKRVAVMIRLGEDERLDDALSQALLGRPAGVDLCLAVPGVPVGKRLAALLRARPDRLRMRIDKPEALNWKLIDDLNEQTQLPKIIVISPTSLSDDGVVRLNGVQGVTVRVEGASFLGVDSVMQLNRIGR